jgi:hypothetical protein
MKADIFQMSIKLTLDVFIYLKEMHIVIYKKRRKKRLITGSIPSYTCISLA